MVFLTGYENFIQIHDSTNSQVYRARRTRDNRSVILKFLNQDDPTSEQIRRYKQEYYLTCQLDAPGIIKAYRLQKWHRSYVISLEDFGGISLKQWLQQREKLTLEEFLAIAIAITESLAQIHAYHIIHKDINPTNIVFNPETQELKIIDFGISTPLNRENPTLKNPNLLEGTLPYMSPEQTGRMNRGLDYRTDFYSLGITFYELLTRELPFVTKDALEFIQWHLAKQPRSPLEIRPSVPTTVAEIILKLMAKNVEDRYQSAWELKSDLEICWQQLTETGKIHPFSLAQQDITESVVLDLATVIKATNAISSEIVLENLLTTLMNILVENAGAERGILILPRGQHLSIAAIAETDSESVAIVPSLPMEEFTQLSTKIVNDVARTGETIVLNDGTNEGNPLGQHSLGSYAKTDSQPFIDDYIQQYQCKSIACIPFINQGKLQGIIYLENNLSVGAFTRERMALLHTLATQAAISLKNARLYETLEQRVKERTAELSHTVEVLKQTQAELKRENNLLKSDEQAETFHYQIGGSLDANSPAYVVRAADRHLYQAMRSGEFCYIFNARQMGKSSLMIRILKRLQKEGYRCIAIDLTRIGGENVTPDQWYKGFAVELWRSFGLLRKVKLKAWWDDRLDLPAPQRLMQFIEEILLVEVKDKSDLEPAKMVIFLDEIDCILSLPFSVNDFFALIRSCYNQRAIDANYHRLTFAFFGVATPSALINDPQKTPFNIGRPIDLEGFKVNEAQPLLSGLKVNNPQTILKEILAWTGGQPFLTQKVCQSIRNTQAHIPLNGEAQWIAELIRENILDNWKMKDDPEHLKTIRDRILRSDRPRELLNIYQKIVLGEEVLVTDSESEQELLLSGLAIVTEGKLTIKNRIYETIFDRQWIERQLTIILPANSVF